MIDIKKEAEAVSGEVIALRRYFHMYPELGMQEYETSAKVREMLEKWDIAYENCGETGVIAKIGQGKKTIALRADMDALSIQEKSDIEYASVNQGVMHACGHDAHTAALLGAAKVLKAHEDELCVGVRLLFQPSEENCGAASIFASMVPLTASMRFMVFIYLQIFQSEIFPLKPGLEWHQQVGLK